LTAPKLAHDAVAHEFVDAAVVRLYYRHQQPLIFADELDQRWRCQHGASPVNPRISINSTAALRISP
jgi:hypothetical protein